MKVSSWNDTVLLLFNGCSFRGFINVGELSFIHNKNQFYTTLIEMNFNFVKLILEMLFI